MDTARAQEPAAADRDEARAVLDALDAEPDAETPSRLRAVADRLDAWVAVDQLAAIGRIDAARRFAGALQGPAYARLDAYLDVRVEAPAESKARRALETSLGAEDAQAVLDTLRAVEPPSEPLLRARILMLRGRAEHAAGEYESAVRALRGSAEAAGGIGWLEGQSLALYRCAASQRSANDFAGSLDALQEMLAVDRRCGVELTVAQGHSLIGATQLMLADYRSAEQSFDAALALYERADLGSKRALVLHNLVVLHERRGAHRAVIAAAARAVEAYESVGSKAGARSARLKSANALQVLGDPARALEVQEDVLRAARADGDAGRPDVARALKGSGASLFRLGRVEEAFERLRDAVSAFEELDDRRSRCAALATLAHYLSESGDHGAAQKAAGSAVGIATELDDPWLRSNALQNLARAQHDAGDTRAALATLAEADRLARELDSDKVLADGARYAARFALHAGRHDDVIRHCKEAAAAEGRRIAGAPGELGVTARKNYARIFDLWARAALTKGDATEAWTALETGRGGAFLEAIENRDAVRAAAIPENLEAALVEANRAEAAAAAQLRRGRASEAGLPLKTLRKLNADLKAAREQRADAVEAIRRESSAAAEWLFPRVASLADVHGALTDRDALVLYGEAGPRQIAVVVTRTAARLVDLGAAAACAAACDAFDPAADEVDALEELRRRLVRPLALEATSKRVLVSPSGPLFHAPFAALLAGREVVHVPSASTYLRLRAGAARSGKGVLAVGDPVYEGTPHAPLPATRGEALAAGGSAMPRVALIGSRANEAEFRTALAARERWRFVHLAAHGLIDAERPMHSGLALTPTAADDGLLTASEIYVTPVPADLVVLSACESGRGRVYRGEGLQGLTRAFLFAGAPRVLCSLWNVDDAATAALMKRFYAALDGGDSPSAALRLAQEHVRSNPNWKHPRYWGAWMLWGTGD